MPCWRLYLCQHLNNFLTWKNSQFHHLRLGEKFLSSVLLLLYLKRILLQTRAATKLPPPNWETHHCFFCPIRSSSIMLNGYLYILNKSYIWIGAEFLHVLFGSFLFYFFNLQSRRCKYLKKCKHVLFQPCDKEDF